MEIAHTIIGASSAFVSIIQTLITRLTQIRQKHKKEDTSQQLNPFQPIAKCRLLKF